MSDTDKQERDEWRSQWEYVTAELQKSQTKVAQLKAERDAALDEDAKHIGQTNDLWVKLRRTEAQIEKLEAALREARERWLSDDLGSNDGDDFLRRVDNLITPADGSVA